MALWENNDSEEDIDRERSDPTLRYRDAYLRLEALFFEEDPIGMGVTGLPLYAARGQVACFSHLC